MMISSSQAANMLGITDRQVRRAVETGMLEADRVGRSLLLHVRNVVALGRMDLLGRGWSDVTREAALDLLSYGSTDRVAGSSKSRLKARVRSAEVASLAGHLIAGRAKVYAGENSDSKAFQSGIAAQLGLGGTLLGVIVSEDFEEEAIAFRLHEDPDGRIVGISGNERHTEILHAFSLYVYGDTRESSAAEQFIKERVARL